MTNASSSPTRPDLDRRRFTMGDLMLLVAGLAVALSSVAGTREFHWAVPVGLVFLTTIAWTPMVLVMRLRQPRPPIRRLARQPGFAAMAAGSIVVGLGGLATIVIAVIRAIKSTWVRADGHPALRPQSDWLWEVVHHFAAAGGAAVIAAWVLLALGGRRRPEPGWIDPLGRTLGVMWIVLFVLMGGLKLATTIE